MNKYLLSIFLILLLSGCVNPSDSRNSAVLNLLGSLPELKLPLSMRLDSNTPFEGVEVTKEGEFSYFFDESNEYLVYFSLLGVLPDTSQYYKILSLTCCSDYDIPYLFVFDKQGNIVSRIVLLSDMVCGVDCGYRCADFLSLNQDGEIIRENKTQSIECDEMGNEIPGTLEEVNYLQRGKVNEEGVFMVISSDTVILTTK